jgi:hypothetical protein
MPCCTGTYPGHLIKYLSDDDVLDKAKFLKKSESAHFHIDNYIFEAVDLSLAFM